MRTAPPDLQAYFAAHGVQQVECVFPDISGYPRGKLMPAAAYAAGQPLRIAQAIPMQAVTGAYSYDPVFAATDPDILLVPDASTLCLVPWATTPRALAVHDGYEADGQLCKLASRSVLQQVLSRYRAAGLQPVVAAELEFYLTAPCPDARDPLRPPALRGGCAEVGQSAFSLSMLNEMAPFWDEFAAALRTMRIPVDTWLHEMGAGQFEVNFLHGDALHAADHAFLFKLAAKEVALKHGMNAVFMAKPIAQQAGSSMHLHISVVDAEGRNIFSNADGSESARFAQFIGGQQAYLKDLMLVYAPFVNSYRRFVVDSSAPVNLHWGHDNRTVGLRVPASGPDARRVENRIAGADANPYLAIAATLAAGLTGIEDACTPSAPLEADGYSAGHALPRSISAAYDAMCASDSARRLLGPEFVAAYTSVKALEIDSYLNEVSAWERRYLVTMA